MSKLISRQAAIIAGQNRYYTGIPCTRGHYSIRVTSTGACVECGKKYRTSDKNKEYMRDYNTRVRAALRKARAEISAGS